MLKIAVLISGGGTNLQAIIDNIENGSLKCKISAVISDKPGVYGLTRAEEKGIPTFVLDKKLYKDRISEEILKIVDKNADLIVLAGFLSILNGEILKRFKNRIINIHPSLIPAFCGAGMYGIKVHKAAIEYGVKYSGCTVHLVDEGTDTGAILIQKVVPVLCDDTPEILQKRILKEEHKALSEAIKCFIDDEVEVRDRKVVIRR